MRFAFVCLYSPRGIEGSIGGRKVTELVDIFLLRSESLRALVEDEFPPVLSRLSVRARS